MYLLDTDIISNLMRHPQSQELLNRLDATPTAFLFTSSITVGEVVYGAYKATGDAKKRVESFDSIVGPMASVLAFDEDAAHHYGRLRADLERMGSLIGDADTRIAAIALVHDLIVVTGNTRHFERVPGLVVENWLL